MRPGGVQGVGHQLLARAGASLHQYRMRMQRVAPDHPTRIRRGLGEGGGPLVKGGTGAEERGRADFGGGIGFPAGDAPVQAARNSVQEA